MPNHFVTVGLCGRDYKRLEALGKEDYDEIDIKPLGGANFCELVFKLPEELEGIVPTTPRCRYRNKETGEWSKDCNGPVGDERNQYEKVELSASEVAALESKYGAADWFDWQSKNWGTKWGTYGTKVHELDGDGSPLLIEFQTAWSPPSAEMMRKIDTYLCENYCLKNIKWMGHDPYDNDTHLIEVADVEASVLHSVREPVVTCKDCDWTYMQKDWLEEATTCPRCGSRNHKLGVVTTVEYR